MPSSSLSPTKSPTQRLPAPSLFVGPPSRNASNTSLSPPATTTNTTSTRNASSLQRSLQDRFRNHADNSLSDTAKGKSPATAERQSSRNLNNKSRHHRSTSRKDSSNSVEARWTEMQNTLDEVEAKAERGPHIFGPAHSDALAALQKAQIALAQSWAKNEQEEIGLGSHDISEQDTQPRMGDADSVKNALEEETENDILLARKRREANDRYFKRVNESVREAISKLDDVAKTMKEVERESKELWEDEDSSDTPSIND